ALAPVVPVRQLPEPAGPVPRPGSVAAEAGLPFRLHYAGGQTAVAAPGSRLSTPLWFSLQERLHRQTHQAVCGGFPCEAETDAGAGYECPLTRCPALSDGQVGRAGH